MYPSLQQLRLGRAKTNEVAERRIQNGVNVKWIPNVTPERLVQASPLSFDRGR
jgi:hypothetical protein